MSNEHNELLCEVDWDKVHTLDDMKKLMSASHMVFTSGYAQKEHINEFMKVKVNHE